MRPIVDCPSANVLPVSEPITRIKDVLFLSATMMVYTTQLQTDACAINHGQDLTAKSIHVTILLLLLSEL